VIPSSLVSLARRDVHDVVSLWSVCPSPVKVYFTRSIIMIYSGMYDLTFTHSYDLKPLLTPLRSVLDSGQHKLKFLALSRAPLNPQKRSRLPQHRDGDDRNWLQATARRVASLDRM
jgi:hypothetical protein